jgi:dihydropyrimidinase
MHHASDYTPYEGLSVTGWPVVTILRGDVVAQDGKIVGEKTGGAFLRRDLSPYAKPAGRTYLT